MSPSSREAADEPEVNRAYVATVMEEIDEEVRRRRASGDLPLREERELDEMFLKYSPVAGRGGSLGAALRVVDSAAFIDPVVPVESARSGGAVVKKGLRTLSFWYVSWVTHQVSQFASGVSRALHLLDERVTALSDRLDARKVLPAHIIDVPWTHVPDAWWVAGAAEALKGASGRVVHAASGDGWLVRLLVEEGVDTYGIDPRPGRVDRAEAEGTDLREEAVAEHLRATESATLGGVVLTGVVDGMTNGERHQLLELIVDRLTLGGRLVVHSLSPSGWASDDAPFEADLASGHPYRAATWEEFLPLAGFDVGVRVGPSGDDYLVLAVLRSRGHLHS